MKGRSADQVASAGGVRFLEEYGGGLRREHQLTRIYLGVTGELLRVRARYELYLEQSYATAELLTPQRTWTVLLEDLADRWHPDLREMAPGARPDALGVIAHDLAERANTLLLLHLLDRRDRQRAAQQGQADA